MSLSSANSNYGAAVNAVSATAMNTAINSAVNPLTTIANAAQAIANNASSAVTTENNRASTAENTLTSNLSTEVTNRTNADSLLVPKTTTINGYALSTSISITAADVSAVNINQLGVANGVATLDATGKLPATLLNSSSSGVTAVLTGYASTTGTISGTDTVLSAIEKLTGNVAVAVGGGVTAVSVVTANGFSGTSSGGNTPAITLSTPLTGLLKGNGTGMVLAVAGTDYALPTGTVAAATTASTVTTAAQPNITSVGILTGLTVTNPIVGSVSGNAGSVTNGVYTNTVNGLVIAAPLTGYVSTAGTVAATDNIVTAIGKLNANITAVGSGALTTTLTGYTSTTGTVTSSDTVLMAIEKLNGNLANVVGGGVSSVSATGPLASTGGTNPTISIAQSSATVPGYLSSADWNTFNTKQAALGFTPVNVTAVGAVSGIATLDATGKLTSGQIPAALVGAIQYQGVWNATTNTPALVSSVGTKGAYYKVSIAGTTSIDGNANWTVGDLVIFDGVVWEQVQGGTSDVVSVVGQIGAITATQIATALSGQTMNIVGSSTSCSGNSATVTNGVYTNSVNGLVLAAPLTGYASSTGTISATDTVLTAIEKLNGNNNAIIATVTTAQTQATLGVTNAAAAQTTANAAFNALGTNFNNQVGTAYTTVLTDASFAQSPGDTLTFNNAAQQLCTIPLNSSVAYPVGATMQVLQLGAGKVTFVGATGVTINSVGGLLSIGAQFAAVTLMQTAINVWILVGGLQA